MNKSFDWNAKKFYTATELDTYIESIKNSFIGKKIEEIVALGVLYTSIGFDNDENKCVKYADEDDWFIEDLDKNKKSFPTHQVALSLDEPVILRFNDKHFEIKYCEFSNAQIAINTIDLIDILNLENNITVKKVNKYFVKNIIGQTLVDIKICHTCIPDNYTSHYRKKGEDMYDEILFIFENGYQLRISSDIDYMVLSEQPSWLKMQKFSKDYWNSFSRYNEEENKPSFSELIASSVPKENSNLQIITKLIYGLDLDIGFDCNNTNSSLWIAESMNWVPNIFYFLEAIIYSKETEIFFYCDEEGRDSFLYVQTINDKKIRFIHLSDKKYIGEHTLNDFNIKQDVIIDKREFVEKFYSAIKKAVATVTIDELNEEGWGHLLNDEYELLKKGSKIIEIFLEVNN